MHTQRLREKERGSKMVYRLQQPWQRLGATIGYRRGRKATLSTTMVDSLWRAHRAAEGKKTDKMAERKKVQRCTSSSYTHRHRGVAQGAWYNRCIHVCGRGLRVGFLEGECSLWCLQEPTPRSREKESSQPNSSTKHTFGAENEGITRGIHSTQ